MAASGELKERIQLLQAAIARGQATGKTLRPEIQAELDSYREQGLLGGSTGGASGSGGKPTEAQSKAIGFLTRALGANEQFEKADVDPRGVVAQGVVNLLPNGVANSFTGDKRQVSENAQRDFVTATLRQESGAAISAGEYDNQYKTFFPQPGDGEEVIKAKAAARRRALDGLIAAAGPVVSDDLREQYASYFPAKEGGGQASVTTGATDGSGSPPSDPSGSPKGPIAFNDELPPQVANAVTLSDQQKASIAALAQSGASAEQLNALYRSYGLQGLSDDQWAPILKFYSDPKNRNVAPIVGDVNNDVTPVDAGDGAAGAVARGAGNALTLGFLDETGALGDTVTQGGTYAENLNKRRGQELFDEQQNGGYRVAGQVVGSLPLGGVEFAGARAAARAAGIQALRSGIGREAALMAANRTFAARTAAEAAGIGGVYGFGDAEGDFGDRLGGAAIGAGVGAATGGALAYGGGRAGIALSQRARNAAAPVLTEQQQALQAAERQGITPFPADVGGSGTRRLTAAVSQTMAGAGPVRAGAEATIDSAEAVRNRVAASIGQAALPEAAGEAARAGAQAFIARTGQRIGRIYDAAGAAAGRARVDTPEARRVLDQELAPILESPVQGPGVGILQGLRDALDNPQTVRGLREARTQIREQFENAGLRGSNLERVAGRVVDAATDDLVNGLRAQGLDRAATQYRVADRLWRQRLETIDDHLTPILGDADGAGRKSGEQIVQGLKSAMQGNNRRFAGFVQALPPNEQSIVRASLIQRLGMATKGNQDQNGEVFSLATFLTNWNEIGDRAKNTLFGQEGRAALNDLATYANQAKQSQRFANHSNTAGAVSNLSAIWNFSTLGFALAAEYGGGRLLASPRVARWLARPPRTANPAATRQHIARLTRIARAEPAIANDVLALQQRLTDAFAAAPMRAAAQGDNESAPVERQQ